MTFVHVLPALHSLAILAKTSSKKSSPSSDAFLFILLILAVGAFLFMRPQRRRQKEQMAMQKQVSVGDEVVTSSGIVGTVRAMNDERVMIEIAPGTTVEMVRRAIGQRIPRAPGYPDEPPPPPPPPVAEESSAPDASDPGVQRILDDAKKDAEGPSGFPTPSPKPDPESEQAPSGEGKNA
jgi:preprotein translocase subunit YajC